MFEATLQAHYKNYEGALKVNDLALKMAEANKSTYFTYLGSIYGFRFHLLKDLKKYDEAYIMALKTKEIDSTDPAKDGVNYSMLLRDIAEMLMEQGKYAAAEKFAFEAVENLESKGPKGEFLMPDLYRVLSRVYVKLGKLEQAVLVLKKAIAFSEQHGKEGTGQKSASLDELSKVYRALGWTDLAELAYKMSNEAKPPMGYISVVGPQSPKNYSPATLDGKSCTLPEYPQEALQRQLRGTVKFRFLIEESGDISAKYISISSDSLLLDSAALQAFSKCKFYPATQDGKAIRSWYSGQFIWNLPN
ncbi:TonB family protein [Undibacterium sp. Ji83W]|uniref:TonB family protein n=1 Tax=Undibacterium sp. Ji83W TaxID=3413043 RepID=UPI003BF0E78E